MRKALVAAVPLGFVMAPWGLYALGGTLLHRSARRTLEQERSTALIRGVQRSVEGSDRWARATLATVLRERDASPAGSLRPPWQRHRYYDARGLPVDQDPASARVFPARIDPRDKVREGRWLPRLGGDQMLLYLQEAPSPNKQRALAVGAVDVAVLRQFLHGFTLSLERDLGAFAVLDGGGTVLFSSAARLARVGRRSSSMRLTVDRDQPNYEGPMHSAGTTRTARGNQLLFAQERIPSTGWSVLVLRPASVVDDVEPVDHRLLASCAGVSALALWLSRRRRAPASP